MASKDEPLEQVAAWFRGRPDMSDEFASLFRRALDEVIDGARTGRWAIAALEKTEKTYIGTKVEILLRYELEVPRGKKLDTEIQGHEVDIKCTVGRNWMIPREAVGQLCLLVQLDDVTNIFRVGLVRAAPSILTAGANQDGKRSIKAEARDHIHWLVAEGALQPNFLSTLEPEVRQQILAQRSGQARIIELFRRVQGRIIPRNAIETVARQLDPMKRLRDARKKLAEEGILVLGHQQDDPEIARKHGVPVPTKGESIAVKQRDR